MPLTHKTYCALSAVLFGLVAILHLVRAINQWAFQIGPIEVPLSLSWIGAAIAAGLSVWGLRLASRRA